MTKSEKGIFVTIRFWTDFSREDGTVGVIPKHGWAVGSLYVRASELHGNRSGKSVMFNNLEELTVKLDQLLKQHGITLVIRDEEGKLLPRLGRSYPKWTWTGA